MTGNSSNQISSTPEAKQALASESIVQNVAEQAILRLSQMPSEDWRTMTPEIRDTLFQQFVGISYHEFINLPLDTIKSILYQLGLQDLVGDLSVSYEDESRSAVQQPPTPRAKTGYDDARMQGETFSPPIKTHDDGSPVETATEPEVPKQMQVDTGDAGLAQSQVVPTVSAENLHGGEPATQVATGTAENILQAQPEIGNVEAQHTQAKAPQPEVPDQEVGLPADATMGVEGLQTLPESGDAVTQQLQPELAVQTEETQVDESTAEATTEAEEGVEAAESTEGREREESEEVGESLTEEEKARIETETGANLQAKSAGSDDDDDNPPTQEKLEVPPVFGFAIPESVTEDPWSIAKSGPVGKSSTWAATLLAKLWNVMKERQVNES